ncbi:HNH endonuclease signature motif containing protein [Vibrio ruber]|uniref:HNH endonuclease signature motif containing protein n=1 Tax=Vibrio ruber TaxID=184755 RepID=UPI0028931DCD|nr:HNH endonuclease signature motif containing protein [Vibrio ruber]WNJ97206.1 HNH endonuclease signature motif containing protein [Vibrio ruber]
MKSEKVIASQTTQIYNLMSYEFAQVEGDFASWKAVSRDEVLSSQFNEGNQELIRNGFTPFPRFREQVGGREKYEIHHVEEIQHGGKVYDVDNIRVTTPKNHIDIHKGK